MSTIVKYVRDRSKRRVFPKFTTILIYLQMLCGQASGQIGIKYEKLKNTKVNVEKKKIPTFKLKTIF